MSRRCHGWKRRERKARQAAEQRRLAATPWRPLEPASFFQALMWYEKGDRTAVARFMARQRREEAEEGARQAERLRILSAAMAKEIIDALGLADAHR